MKFPKDLENSGFSVKQHLALLFFKYFILFLITLAWVWNSFELVTRHAPMFFFRKVQGYLEVLQRPWKFWFWSKTALCTNIIVGAILLINSWIFHFFNVTNTIQCLTVKHLRPTVIKQLFYYTEVWLFSFIHSFWAFL